MLGFANIHRKPETNEYYFGNEKVFELVKYKPYPKLFKVKFEDDSLSPDFYNATRAAAYGRKIYTTSVNHTKDTTLEG